MSEFDPTSWKSTADQSPDSGYLADEKKRQAASQIDQPYAGMTTTATIPYIEGGYYPHKPRTLGERVGQIASLGIYSPDNRNESELNKFIGQAQVAQNIKNQDARNAGTIAREQDLKDTIGLAHQFEAAGHDYESALQLAVEARKKLSGTIADRSLNKNIVLRAGGAAPFAADTGAATEQSVMETARTNMAKDRALQAQLKEEMLLGVPGTKAQVSNYGNQTTSNNAQLQAIQSHRAIGDDALRETLIDQSGGPGALMLRDINANLLNHQLTMAKGKRELAGTTAGAAGEAQDITSGAYERARQAQLAKAHGINLAPGAKFIDGNGKVVENPINFSTYKAGTGSDGEDIIRAARGQLGGPSTVPAGPAKSADGIIIDRAALRPKVSNQK